MRKVKSVVLALSVIVFAACGSSENGEGGAEAMEDYFIKVKAEGEEHTVGADQTSFFGDKISGETKFTVGESNMVLFECWNQMGADGITGLEGKTFKSDVNISGKEYKGVDATIEKVEKESDQGDMGANYDISGSIKGEVTGSFKVSAFKMH